MLTFDELKALATDLESHRVERKRSLSEPDRVREAICAFANDLPGTGRPGYVLVGVEDDGRLAGLPATDELLRDLSAMRDDGKIQPIPSMIVYNIDVPTSGSVVVVEVHPADAPPVRVRGRVWVRPGPRRGIATLDEERRLTERRVSHARTFDQTPCRMAKLQDLDLELFRGSYLPAVIAKEVLDANQRTVEDQLASLRFLDPATGVPTFGGVLALARDPLQFVPGAYIQFVRFDGLDMAAPVVDAKEVTGSLVAQLRTLVTVMQAQIRSALVRVDDLRSTQVPDYPMAALRELAHNAVMHRNYETSNNPVRVSWFADRVEISNPGGLFGEVTPETFGRRNDYRNRVLAEAMKGLGFVERYGVGVGRVRDALRQNGNPEPQWTFEPTYVLATLQPRRA